MTDDPLTTCPECGSHIRRVVYPAGVVFKGSGFYKTDHAKSGAVASETNGDSKKAESADGSANASHGESKSSSETSTASSSGSSDKTGSSESKSTAPAATK